MHQPWHPIKFDRADVMAMKAVATGTANEAQQKQALRFVIENIAGTYDETYWADSERNSSFAQGKRFVGLQIVKMCNLSGADLARLDAAVERERMRRVS